MAKRGSAYRSKARPYLTSEEVMSLSGAPRRTLDKAAELGMVNPVRFEERRGVLGWTFEQAEALRRAETLRRQGLSLEEQASTGDGDASMAHMVAMEREARQNMRRRLVQRRHEDDMALVGAQEGLYLRYIPQRWLAAMPIEGADPGSDPYVTARMLLQEVANHVGWCATGIGGSIAGAGKGGEGGLVFLELASQPLPFPVPGQNPDGGCYRDFGGICPLQEEGADCAVCPRKGEGVSNGDRLRWLSEVSRAGADAVPAAPELAPADISCGPWEPYAAVMEQGGSRSAPARSVAGTTARMPLGCELPGGVFCAVLPAGFYLCLQAPQHELLTALAAMRATVAGMRTRDFTPEDALARTREIEDALAESGLDKGLDQPPECLSPLTGAPMVCEPEYEGWWQTVAHAETHALAAATMTSLMRPGTSDIVCSSAPLASVGSVGIHELQVLLDPSSVPAQLKKKKKKGARRFVLGALAGRRRAEEAEDSLHVRCRRCASRFDAPRTRSVAICPDCGQARVLPNTRGPQALAALQQAEEELARGDWEAAQASCALCNRWAPGEPEAAWCDMLARYQISWQVGGRAVVGRPELGPMTDDESCESVLKQAGPATWTVYANQAAALEAARQDALDRGKGELRLR